MKKLLIPVVLVLTVAVGCSWFEEAYDRATTEQLDGTVPAVELAKDAGKLYVNPADYVTWKGVYDTLLYILVGGGVIGGGGVAAKKVFSKKQGETKGN